MSQVKGCGLNVMPKSHLFSERKIKQFNREDVEQGAPKNQMGFLYAPKEILDFRLWGGEPGSGGPGNQAQGARGARPDPRMRILRGTRAPDTTLQATHCFGTQ